MKLLMLQFSAVSRHFVSLRSKYSPQHPVLKHPPSIELLGFRTLSIVRILNN
jgi:hypothetical protein